jgi:hypothetical protein
MAEKLRFNKFIPLFGDKYNDRIRLFINELKEDVDTNRSNKNLYIPDDVHFYYNTTPIGMQNRFFTNKDPNPNASDLTIHPEWIEFFAQISHNLGNKYLLKSDNKNKDLFDAVQVLKNFNSNSIEELVCVIYSKIAVFKIKNDPNFKSFYKNNSDLDQIEEIYFMSNVDIFNELSFLMVKTNENIFEHILVLSADSIVTCWDNANPGQANALSTFINMIHKWHPYYKDLRDFLVNSINNVQPPAGPPVDQTTWLSTVIVLLNYYFFDSERFNKREFGYKLDKFFITTILEEHIKEIKPLQSSNFFNDDILSDEQKYYRRDGELYMKDKNGKEIKLTFKWAEENLTIKDKCLGTGFVDGNDLNGQTHTCSDYLRNCLRGKNIDKCKTYLHSPSFWTNAIDEVENMTPLMAVKTLLTFEFQIEEYHDTTAKRNLKRMRNVSQWLDYLLEITKSNPQKLNITDYDLISKNERLKGYLRMIVHKMNKNPAILNNDYNGLTDQKYLLPSHGKLTEYGIGPYVNPHGFSLASIDKLQLAFDHERLRISSRYGIPIGLSPNVQKVGYILAGGNINIDLIEDKLSNETKQTWNIIETHYLILNKRLGQFNKTISEGDHVNIMALINNLKRAEIKTNQAILYFEKYLDLLQKYGVKDNTSVLSVDHLQKFVDTRNNYFSKVAKKQSDLISIIKAIAENVNNEVTPDSNQGNILNATDINIGDLFKEK